MRTLIKTSISLLLLAAPCLAQRSTFYAQNVTQSTGSFSSMALIGNNSATGCPTSGTTCTIAISPNISAGQAVLACAYSQTQTSDTWLVSSDNSGTGQQVLAAFNWSNPSTALGTHSCYLILNAGAESTNITYTFSGAQDSHKNSIRVWAGSYTGSPNLDGANSLIQASVSTATADTFTPSNGNDTGIMDVIAFQNVNSFSGMTADATGTHFGAGHNLSFSGALTPTATLASSATFVNNAEVYLGYNNGNVPKNQTVQLFCGSSNQAACKANGTNPAGADLLSGTYGYTGCAWNFLGTTTDFTYDTAASKTLQNATGRLNDGSNTTDSGTTGLVYATGHANTEIICGQAGGHPFTSASAVSAGVWVQTNHSVAVADNDDVFGISGSVGGEFALAQSKDSGGTSRNWGLECITTSTTQFVAALSLNTWYWLDMYYSAKAPVANLTLTSVANASGGNTVYTGTITGGGSNALVGNYYYITDFTNSANDGGPFQATASTTTTLTLNNASGVAETHSANAAQTNAAGTAGLHTFKVYDSSTPPVLLGQVSCPASGSQPQYSWVGNGNIAGTAGYHYWFDGWKISFDATDPLLP